ncbi:hypothetical protein FACS189472_05880 [Alphaproteobacteria bacterium]|nr:hypothetical protein FACS189472_05880 [Alphaproteobacteria bacterium]
MTDYFYIEKVLVDLVDDEIYVFLQPGLITCVVSKRRWTYMFDPRSRVTCINVYRDVDDEWRELKITPIKTIGPCTCDEYHSTDEERNWLEPHTYFTPPSARHTQFIK